MANYTGISLEVQCKDTVDKYWSDFEYLDQHFRREVYNGNMGDLEKAREQLQLGTRFNLLAYSPLSYLSNPDHNIILGFVRVDLDPGKLPCIGSVYVRQYAGGDADDMNIRKTKFSLQDTPWLQDDLPERFVWQHLIRGACILLENFELLVFCC